MFNCHTSNRLISYYPNTLLWLHLPVVSSQEYIHIWQQSILLTLLFIVVRFQMFPKNGTSSWIRSRFRSGWVLTQTSLKTDWILKTLWEESTVHGNKRLKFTCEAYPADFQTNLKITVLIPKVKNMTFSPNVKQKCERHLYFI